MRSKFTYFLCIAILLASCQSSTKENTVDKATLESAKAFSLNEKWKQAINTNDLKLLETLYTENAFVLSKSGIDVSSRSDILDLVKDSDFKVNTVGTIKTIKANDVYDYEIGNFTNKDGGLMKHLIIWKNANGNQLRELEFLAEFEDAKIDLDVIADRRAEWMTLCNAHDAKSLIKLMYAEHTMYYNRERLIEGRERLIEEYQYMNSPDYRLALEPILIEPVSKDIVYEIGQCKGSYNGKYILVWQQDAQGVWRILFDSNI